MLLIQDEGGSYEYPELSEDVLIEPIYIPETPKTSTTIIDVIKKVFEKIITPPVIPTNSTMNHEIPYTSMEWNDVIHLFIDNYIEETGFTTKGIEVIKNLLLMEKIAGKTAKEVTTCSICGKSDIPELIVLKLVIKSKILGINLENFIENEGTVKEKAWFMGFKANIWAVLKGKWILFGIIAIGGLVGVFMVYNYFKSYSIEKAKVKVHEKIKKKEEEKK